MFSTLVNIVIVLNFRVGKKTQKSLWRVFVILFYKKICLRNKYPDYTQKCINYRIYKLSFLQNKHLKLPIRNPLNLGILIIFVNIHVGLR